MPYVAYYCVLVCACMCSIYLYISHAWRSAKCHLGAQIDTFVRAYLIILTLFSFDPSFLLSSPDSPIFPTCTYINLLMEHGAYQMLYKILNWTLKNFYAGRFHIMISFLQPNHDKLTGKHVYFAVYNRRFHRNWNIAQKSEINNGVIKKFNRIILFILIYSANGSGTVHLTHKKAANWSCNKVKSNIRFEKWMCTASAHKKPIAINSFWLCKCVETEKGNFQIIFSHSRTSTNVPERTKSKIQFMVFVYF